jgi:hypothetical protein
MDTNPREGERALEAVLTSFDSLSEWPDLIGFLGRLSRALGASSPLTLSQGTLLRLSKRLAVCLTPALPSGVHLKTPFTWIGAQVSALGQWERRGIIM